jgi:hypothetical protein
LAEVGNIEAVQRMLQTSPYWFNQLTGYGAATPGNAAAAAAAAAATHANPSMNSGSTMPTAAQAAAAAAASGLSSFPGAGLTSGGLGLAMYYQQAAAAAGLGKAMVHE